jgi:ABC-type phosphate/phosphonate transport system ATPase subunit
VPEAPEQFSRRVELIDAATAEIWLCPTKAAVMLPPDASLDRAARSVYAAVDGVGAVVGEDFRLRTVLTNLHTLDTAGARCRRIIDMSTAGSFSTGAPKP